MADSWESRTYFVNRNGYVVHTIRGLPLFVTAPLSPRFVWCDLSTTQRVWNYDYDLATILTMCSEIHAAFPGRLVWRLNNAPSPGFPIFPIGTLPSGSVLC